ncbi:c-type cytochrome [Undibacterium pigrum]|uniref:Sulfur dehydrogenase subunit SoxD n=1 Tax=Undibacterium pigrum TaxID=401470 RepID=A0A318IQU1_9BURK|nr:c-type cytochrome [Undibacterium pigrum]PXX37869.1 sulfur dehydrogenase subunit SoxD [Undibacterium pigrum]
MSRLPSMKMLTKTFGALVLVTTSLAASADNHPGIGRAATPKEVAAWDIDVRPDFRGLPKGRGSVDQGQQIWDGKCASCHGTFGESNEVFTPIVGGTTKDDIKNGRVAALSGNSQPQRTTLMKVATVSTLWDYINRAMPWNAPKTLTTDEVYAVTAYILNMGGIVADDFVMSDDNIAEVQKRMPNRLGMTEKHGLWQTKGKPDVKNAACMKDCLKEVQITSELPGFARSANGNPAEQNRMVGAVRGVDLNKATVVKVRQPAADEGLKLAKQYACTACHGIKDKVVGPGFAQIAEKYKGDANAEASLSKKIKLGGSGAWGAIPMPPQGHVKDSEVKTMLDWIMRQ